MAAFFIPLRRRDGSVRTYTMVDACDEHLGRYRWHLTGRGYVARTYVDGDGIKRAALMHREVMRLSRGDKRVVDHINHDQLDNRRENLRVGTQAQNLQNMRGTGGGVWLRKDTRRWTASVKVDGHKYNLGCFDTEQEARSAAVAFRAAHAPFSREARAA